MTHTLCSVRPLVAAARLLQSIWPVSSSFVAFNVREGHAPCATAVRYMPIISESTWLTDYLFVLSVLCSLHLFEYVAVHSFLRVRKRREAQAAKKAEEEAKKADTEDIPPLHTTESTLGFLSSEALSCGPDPGDPPCDGAPNPDLDLDPETGVRRRTNGSLPAPSIDLAATPGHTPPASAKEVRQSRRKVQLDKLIGRTVAVGCELDRIFRVVSALIMIVVSLVFYLTA